MIKICCFCTCFGLDMGQEDWSEYTPGWEAEIGCNKNYWKMSNYDGTYSYQEYIKMASVCPDFNPVKPPRKKIKPIKYFRLQDLELMKKYDQNTIAMIVRQWKRNGYVPAGKTTS